MEHSEYSLLEEFIMSPKTENNINPFPNDQFIVPNAWSLTCFDQPQDLQYFPAAPNTNNYIPSFLELISPPILPEYASYNYDHHLHEIIPISTLPIDQEEIGFLDNYVIDGFEDIVSSFNNNIKDADENTVPNLKSGSVKKGKNGQPSKNLMAERRRRKRLNDRLSMLRSIVPKISKMDRTSILGDTIDYTRELLDKIHKLKEEGNMDETLNHINLIGNHLKEQKPNEMLVRNPPKFDVERTNHNTRVEVCCTTKPGLLISTLGTLDALGLDIQQCVISCFNDFSLRASCHEVDEHRSLVSCEDVKQALFRNAGYGGRCL